MYIIRQSVRGFYYYWSREKAAWQGLINNATLYDNEPIIKPGGNGDIIQIILFNEAIRHISALKKISQ